MRQFRPIAAMLAVIVLFAFYLLDVDRVERGELLAMQQQQVLFQNPSDAVALEFENSNGLVRVEREKAGDPWRITKPVEESANSTLIDAYLENLRGAKKQARFPAKNLADYGLDHPRSAVRLTMDTKDGRKTYALEFGSQPAKFGNVYAMIRGENEIFTVSEWFFRQSGKSIADLRDRTITDMDFATLNSFDVGTLRNHFEVAREDKDSPWMIEQTGKEPVPADRQLLERIQTSLTQGSFQHIDDNPTTPTEQLGFDNPALRIIADKKVELVVGKAVPEREQFFVRGAGGRVGIASAALFADLFRDPIEWGTKRMIWIKAADIDSIETMSGSTMMRLKRKDGAWVFELAPGVPVREDAVESFIDSLTTLSAVSLVRKSVSEDEWPQYGIVDESYNVRVTAKDGTVQSFHFGSTDARAGTTYVLRQHDSSLWQVNVRGMAEVYKFRADLEERRLAPDLANRTARFEIKTSDATVIGEKQGMTWSVQLTGQPAAQLPASQVSPFLTAFQNLEVQTEMYTKDHLPPIATFRFYEAGAKDPFLDAALVKRDESGAEFDTRGKRVQFSSKEFEPLDNELARLVIFAKAKAEKEN